MEENGSAGLAMAGSATGNLRAHCAKPDACTASPRATLCRQCSARRMGSDPAINARRVEAIRAKFASDADFRQRKTADLHDALAIKRTDPAWVAAAAERGRKHAAEVLLRPDVAARNRSPETRAASGRKTSATRLAWCPPEYRAHYIRLLTRKHILAVDARRMTLQLVEDDRLAKLDHEIAAAHLRRLAPVSRCTAAGRLDPVGTHWRYGSRVMERIEVIRLAVAKGWQPDRIAA